MDKIIEIFLELIKKNKISTVIGTVAVALMIMGYLFKDIIARLTHISPDHTFWVLCLLIVCITCVTIFCIHTFRPSKSQQDEQKSRPFEPPVDNSKESTFQNITSDGDYNQNNQTKVDGNATVVHIDTVKLQGGLADQDKRDKLAKDLGMVEGAFNSFFAAVGRDSVPIEDWPKMLTDFAKHYNELLAKVEADNVYLKDDIEPIRALIERGELDKARDVLDAIEQRDAQTNDDDDQYVEKKLNQAKVQEIYGDIEALDIRYKAAAERYEKAFNILNGDIGHNKQTQAIKEQIIDYAIAAGRYFNDAGLYDKALPLKKISVERARRDLSPTHPTLATALNNLAELYRTQGKYDEAEPLYEQAIKIVKHNHGDNHPSLATSLNNLAGLYREQGKYDEAERLYQLSMEIFKKSLGDNHPHFAASLNNLAELYRAQDKYDEAEPLYLQDIEITKQSLGENHPYFATSLNNLAGLYQAQGKYDKAEPRYQQAIEIVKQNLGENHPYFASSLNNLALLYKAQGKYDEAEPLLEQALTIFKDKLPADHPNIKIVELGLTMVREAMGKK